MDFELLDEEIERASDNIEEIDTTLFSIKKALEVDKCSPTCSTSSSTPTAAVSRLPKFEIPTFEGDVLKFPSYWELFEANVHKVHNLDDVQRFSYLRTTLKGEPATLIANLELTSANYKDAVAMLKERYGDK